MPIWENTSNAHLFLPRENGLKPDIELLPNRTFNGSKAYYTKYVGSPHWLITRSADGYTTTGTVLAAPNRISFNIEGSISVNNIDATAADVAINALLVVGVFYSAFGRITWDDGTGTNFSKFFEITGNGDHGGVNEAIFNLSAATPVGPVQEPQAAGSRIDCLPGTVMFSMTGAGARNPSIEIIYEVCTEGERNTAIINQLLERPNLTHAYTYVSAASDVGSEYYVAGSAGQIKTEKIFSTGAKVGDRAKEITYYYQDATYSTRCTKQSEKLTSVVAADLV